MPINEFNDFLSENIKNSDSDLLLKRIDLETRALNYYINENSETDKNIILLSTFCILNKTEAQEMLSILNTSTDNEVTEWLLSSGTFFPGSHVLLSDIINKSNYDRSMALFYNLYKNLTSFYKNIDLSPELIDVETIGNTLFDQDIDIAYAAAKYIYDYTSSFEILPDWLSNIVNLWEDSLINYLSIKHIISDKELITDINNFETNEGIQNIQKRFITTYNFIMDECNEANKSNLKNWRQYLNSEYISGLNSDLKAADFWIQGELMDALVTATRNSQLLKDALALYFSTIRENDNSEISSLIDPYLIDPQTPWNDAIIKRASYLYTDINNINLGVYQNNLNYETALKNDISLLAYGYDYSKKDKIILKNEIDNKLTELDIQRAFFDQSTNNFSISANDFSEMGLKYDSLYSLVKSYYAEMEEKRFIYEKEDAIRRWASTAYLESDFDDIEYCNNHLERANIALLALMYLYNNEDECRPYENENYNKLYNEYKESFSRMMLTLQARDLLNESLTNKYQNNQEIYQDLNNIIYTLGSIPANYENYNSSLEREKWDVKDIITMKNGLLSFSYDENYRLSGITDDTSFNLNDYFTTKNEKPDEIFPLTDFETALRELGLMMDQYFANPDKYTQWSYARDYLIRRLIQSNPDIASLDSLYINADELGPNGNLGSLNMFFPGHVFTYVSVYHGILDSYQYNAYNSMNDEEKKYLEFYTILTLFNNTRSDTLFAFSTVSKLTEMSFASAYVNNAYKEADKHDVWYNPERQIFRIIKDMINIPRYRIFDIIGELADNIAADNIDLILTLKKISYLNDLYSESCSNINELTGAVNNDYISWNEISISLNKTGALTNDDISSLQTYWEEMILDLGGNYKNVPEALTKLAQWARSTKEDNKRDLEYQWISDEQNRQEKENQYFNIVDEFINGNSNDTSVLKEAAILAYGKNSSSIKTHLENLENVIVNDLGEIIHYGPSYNAEYTSLTDDYVTLITKAHQIRYNSELAAREVEWAQQRFDIEEKIKSWQNAASLILERGRNDWKNSLQRIQNSYNKWFTDFTEQYKVAGNS
jgi:hypothetical protein